MNKFSCTVDLGNSLLRPTVGSIIAHLTWCYEIFSGSPLHGKQSYIARKGILDSTVKACQKTNLPYPEVGVTNTPSRHAEQDPT